MDPIAVGPKQQHPEGDDLFPGSEMLQGISAAESYQPDSGPESEVRVVRLHGRTDGVLLGATQPSSDQRPPFLPAIVQIFLQ